MRACSNKLDSERVALCAAQRRNKKRKLSLHLHTLSLRVNMYILGTLTWKVDWGLGIVAKGGGERERERERERESGYAAIITTVEIIGGSYILT